MAAAHRPVRVERVQQLYQTCPTAPGHGTAVVWLPGGAGLYWLRRRQNPVASANIPAAS